MASIYEAFSSALEHYQAGQVGEAEQICRQILAADESCASAWNFLGVIELGRRHFSAATKCIQTALRLVPDWAEAQNNLGLVLHDQGRLDLAAQYYRRALELKPDFAEAHHNLGLVLHDAGRPVEAMEHYRRALAIRPDHANAHVNLANAFKQLGELEEAIEHYRQAMAIRPDFAEAVHNLGSTYQAQGNYAEAVQCYERAIQLAPQFAEAHKNLSQLRLLLEDFSAGWDEYEWRWQTGEMHLPTFSQPVWIGESLRGKTILLHAEQGLGDTLQFIRYARVVQERGAETVVLCPPRLVPLLSHTPGIDRLCGEVKDLPPFDYHIPLLSLPRQFQTTIDSIPASGAYLFAAPELVQHWRDRLDTNAALRIGVNWRGRSGERDFQLRDLPLAALAELAKVPGVELISLQRGEGREELLESAYLNAIIDLGEDVDTKNGAFMDTAAIMYAVDLVITSDTAVAHLAGGLGVPVWVGLPFVPNWRWFLNRDTSPWYPTMRLFRQSKVNDWSGVFAEMAETLAQRVSQR